MITHDRRGGPSPSLLQTLCIPYRCSTTRRKPSQRSLSRGRAPKSSYQPSIRRSHSEISFTASRIFRLSDRGPGKKRGLLWTVCRSPNGQLLDISRCQVGVGRMRCLRHGNKFTAELRNGFHQLLNSPPFSVSVSVVDNQAISSL